MTLSIATTQQLSPDLQDLRDRLAGDLVTRDSATYDESRRVPNITVRGRPLAIVQAATEDDIVEAVRFARRLGLPLAVRSGGHSVAGHNMIDDTLVIDVSRMKGVSIDAESGIARVQSGARSVDLAGPAHAYGLALSTGDTATVGLGGLITGGGIGFMARKYGLAIDNLLSARVVTAEGELVTASPTEHEDLFWAIRGGGGNFGIITEFELQLARVGQVLGGALVLPATREVVRGYLDYIVTAPDELTTITNLMHAPPAPFIPEEHVGDLVLVIFTVWAGDLAEGERAIAPLRALAEPVADAISPMPYPAIFQFTAPLEEPHGVAIHAMFSDEVSDDVIDATLAAVAAPAGPMSVVQFRGLGGAVSRVSSGETAFAHRRQPYFTTILGVWQDPDDDPARHWSWANALWEQIRGESSGTYVNFLADQGEGGVRDAYPSETYARLAETKRKYDPDNVFRFNQNIKPAE